MLTWNEMHDLAFFNATLPPLSTITGVRETLPERCFVFTAI